MACIRSGCVGRVGPIKDSLTYRPSSQGWASRVLPLIRNVCMFGMRCMYVWFVFYVGCLVVSWFLSALSLVSFSWYAINMFFHSYTTCEMGFYGMTSSIHTPVGRGL